MNIDTARLIDLSYRATLDQSFLPQFVQELYQGFDASGANAIVIASDGVTFERAEIIATDKTKSGYFDGWFRDDPQIPFVLSVGQPTFYTSRDHLDELSPNTAEYMRWQRRVGNQDHHTGIVVPLGNGDRRAAIVIHRGDGAGPMPADEMHSLRSMAADITRAIHLGYRHSEMLIDRYWEGLTANDHNSALLLNEFGRVVRITPDAERLVVGGDGLSIARDRLTAPTPLVQTTIDQLIDRAIITGGARSGAVEIPRPSGKRSLILVAYPLVRSLRFLAPFEAAALIRIVERPGVNATPGRLLAQAFGLTPKEVDLTLLLQADHSVESAANMLRIVIATARLHLHRIFQKTGTTRQSELIRLLAALA